MENELEDTGGSRVYELGFHLDPELPSEEVKKAFGAVKELVEKHGSLVSLGEPVQLQLAYTISRQENAGRRDFDTAYFAWIAYETSAENHAKLLGALAEDTRIIRHIDVITTKEAARHAAELRIVTEKMALEKSEEVADAELDAAIESAAA